MPAHWAPNHPPLQANEILHHKLTLNGYLAEFTGQGMDTITADTDRDFFMSAQEAVGGPASPAPLAAAACDRPMETCAALLLLQCTSVHGLAQAG